jgi:phosphopantetheinyl transferase
MPLLAKLFFHVSDLDERIMKQQQEEEERKRQRREKKKEKKVSALCMQITACCYSMLYFETKLQPPDVGFSS